MEKSPLYRIVYDIVNEIQDIKAGNNQEPDYATKIEIFNSLQAEVMEALRGLYVDGMIEFHKTINGMEMFGIKRVA